MSVEVQDWSHALGSTRTVFWIDRERVANEVWDYGSVSTPRGLVSVHRYFCGKSSGVDLEMIAGGRLHGRHYGKLYSRRHCVTLAKAWAEELAGEET